MVDLLVLVRAQRYTGFVFSSFSWIIQVNCRSASAQVWCSAACLGHVWRHAWRCGLPNQRLLHQMPVLRFPGSQQSTSV